MTSPNMTTVRTPEDAARHYDMAGLDGWVDELDESNWRTIALLMCLYGISAVATFGSMLLAAVFEP